MRVMVVDEDKQAVERLQHYLEAMDRIQFVGSASSGIEAITLCAQLKPDIVILDVRVKGTDGIELAKSFNEKDFPRCIIMTSHAENYAIQAYRVHALDFLLKPIDKEKLESSLHYVTQFLYAKRVATDQSFTESGHISRTHLCTKSRQGIKLIPIDDIYYFKAEQKYVTAVYRGGQVLVEDTIKDLEKQYQNSFLRIHRNTLVAKHFIDHLHRNKDGDPYLILKEIDAQLKISRRIYPLIRNLMSH